MVRPGTNRQSVAAIPLRNGGVTGFGMCLSLGKSLPSLGHLNQKGLLPARVDAKRAVWAARAAGKALRYLFLSVLSPGA